MSTTEATARVVLVTGGNRGIGQAIASKFQELGDRVVVTYRSGTAPVGVDSVQMDVSSTESVTAGFAEIEGKFGPVEILVANAGITKDSLLMRMSEDDFEGVVNTNLAGAFRVAKAASRGMLKQRKGRMIFIGSVVGLSGSAGQANYAATKSGLVGFARSVARELGSRGITANVVAPGFVETDMTAVLEQSRREEIVASVPLGRFCTPDEIAGVVTFLASESAGYITGAVIPVDGGMGMGH
jgi:3-oxoacyl-[acyl-carrier protein] reductase